MSNTIWQPRVQKGNAPIYRAIADAIERDLEAGVLAAGSRLPTHRDLAARLGVTTLTITRAYGEAARRGLVESTVGRGTFVRAHEPAPLDRHIDLSRNILHGADDLELPPELEAQLNAILRTPGYDIPAAGTPRHRSAGAAWIARSGLHVAPEQVLVMPGGQHGLHTLLATLLGPGETLLCEPLAYPGFRGVTGVLRARVETVALDEEGITPRALDKACRATHAKLLYCVPTFQNPTGRLMSEARRRDVAEVARKHGVTVIEDDVYGFLLEKKLPTLTSLLPGQACYLGSVAKSTSASLRVGFIAAPEPLVPRLEATLAATAAFASTVAAEVFTLLVESGQADRVVQRKRAFVLERQRVARRIFGDALGGTHASSPHAWLQLTSDWDAQDLAQQAQARGIVVVPAGAFSVDRKDVPNAIRIALGAPRATADVESAFRTLASIVSCGRVASMAVV